MARQRHTLVLRSNHRRTSNKLSSASPIQTRILVVDDHGIVRDGIRALLGRESGLDVVALAGTGEQAVLIAEDLRPDMIIMDLVLPGLNGIDATKRILSSLPQTKIIVLSACSTSEHVYRALHAGARGYVLKDALGSEIVRAVHTVLSGKQYLSESIAELLPNGLPSEAGGRSPLERLSRREREVLHRTVEGYSSTQIALQLSLSPKTVDTYRSRLMQKLGVSNRSALIRFAIQHAMAPC
ncbi:MAG TPA: response regulator transcription factor [Steroidobacteraceae bacterium]|nr:response regulator transcription factor [Steroidobacteraceae bacterium]